MPLKSSLLTLALLHSWDAVFAGSIRGTTNVNLERNMQVATVCPVALETYFYTMTVNVITSTSCSAQQAVSVGGNIVEAIQQLDFLSDYLQESDVQSDICETPAGGSRRLSTQLSYNGGGRCRLCPPDDDDRRELTTAFLASTSATGTTSSYQSSTGGNGDDSSPHYTTTDRAIQNGNGNSADALFQALMAQYKNDLERSISNAIYIKQVLGIVGGCISGQPNVVVSISEVYSLEDALGSC